MHIVQHDDADSAMPKVVIITGGSSGIGRSTGVLFARRGWRVGLIARGEQGLSECALEITAAGASVSTATADVTDSAALSVAANAIITSLGPVDVWINCAGNGVYGRFEDVPEKDFRQVTDVTYHGTVNGTRVALSHMRKRGQGVVINVCSAAAFHGLPLLASYSGAKAAVRAFGEAVRGELRLERSRIRIRSVFPPAVNTPFFSHAISYMGWPARPVGPVYQPEVVAEGILLAAAKGKTDTVVSGTAAAFSLACRLSPDLIAWCMSKLNLEDQSTRDQSACELAEPTVHDASQRSLGARGPFGDGAREWSAHNAIKAAKARMLKAFWFKRRARPLSTVALPPTPDVQAPHQEQADLAIRFGDS